MSEISGSRRGRVARARALRTEGLRTLVRPAAPGAPAFQLAYNRPRPVPGSVPVVILPGGPGLCSALSYESARKAAVRDHGLDVVMIEHRGVGLSRRDRTGADLPPNAITVTQAARDVVAVLDAEGIGRAVVTGASYGTYLAQAVGALFPERVAGMVLDSTVLTAQDHHDVRRHARALLWDGSTPQTRDAARKLRILVEDRDVPVGEIGPAVRTLYEFGGADLVERFLDHVVVDRARSTRALLRTLLAQETTAGQPYLMEFDLVGHLAFRELNYCPEPDGRIFDPALEMRETARRVPAFEAEPFDFPSLLPGFAWPTAVLSGERDLRTPRPVAERTAGLLPDGVLVPVPGLGHSALDIHRDLHLTAARAVRDGDHRSLPSRLPGLARRRPRGNGSRMLDKLVRAALLWDRARTIGARQPLPPR